MSSHMWRWAIVAFLVELTVAEATGLDLEILDADNECSSASCALQALQFRSSTSKRVELEGERGPPPFYREFWKAMKANSSSEVKAFMEGHDSTAIRQLLFSRQPWYNQRPALVVAAQTGNKDLVVTILEYAKANLDKKDVQDILCTERLSTESGSANGYLVERPAPGHHALTDAKTDAIRQYILGVAGEVGSSDFQAELKGGRCQRVEDEEAAKKRAREEHQQAYEQMKQLTADTPPAEAAGILLKYYGRTGKGPFQAAESAVMRSKFSGSVLKLIINETGIQAFRGKDSNRGSLNLLFRAVELAHDHSRDKLHAVHAVTNVLDLAQSVGGPNLVKELMTEPVPCPSPKIKNCSTASLAKLPEVREILLNAADSTWATDLKVAPLYPQSFGDAVAIKRLPKRLQVAGAGDVKANGNYELVLTADGGIAWSDGHAQWVKTDDPDCNVHFYRYAWAFVISTAPRTRAPYQTAGNVKFLAAPTNHTWEACQTDKPPYPTVEAIK